MNWFTLALLSGLCAATNGLFAKLTTTALTTSIAHSVAGFIGLESQVGVEVVVRGIFFVLNLAFNAIMWTLFTAALSRGNSATTVSVINTTSNFLAAAMFGWYFFGEALPGSWWIGAGMLIAGSVVISRKDVMKKKEEEGYTKLGGDGDVMERGRQADDDEDDEDDEDGGVGISSSREPSADSADVQNVKLRRT
ncbi:hypothetical protein BZA77DRAFT_121894 [Pyronema omphalodes]|nr:hypothetical protein BZA77DRAFT_121894 [Pyronema omphalodes]